MSSHPKTALITGGARRIGEAITRYIHSQGWQVIIHCYQSITQARTLSYELNHLRPESAEVFIADLGETKVLQALAQQLLEKVGQLDALINNASCFIKTDLNALYLDRWNTLFNVNVLAPYALSLAARPFLAKTQGCIVNITDAHKNTPLRGYAEYAQTKAALEMQTKALAKEFAPDIRVNAVAPGAIIWPEGDNALPKNVQEQIRNEIPLRRTGAPIHIAQAVFSLIENSFITAETLSVDGGRGLS